LQILIALVLAVSLEIALGVGNPNPANAAFITNLAINRPKSYVLGEGKVKALSQARK
jgi:hypothetical protein